MRHKYLVPALLLALSLAGPTTAAQVSAQTADGFDPARPVKLAFIPPLAAPADANGGPVACPLGGESFAPCPLSDAAESELSHALAARLAGLPGVTLVPQAEVNAAAARLKQKNPAAFGLTANWQAELAREAGADYALTGFIYCWRDRSGSAFGTTTPASVGFCLHLIEAGTGKLTWRMRYEDEQKSLFDDLLGIRDYLRRGGKWITSAEMAGEAAAETRRRLPWGKP